MYHLIVSSDPEEYDNGWFVLDRARVLKGYTCEIFTQRYAALTEHAITEIRQFPALFAYERFNKKDARIGWITRIQAQSKAVRCSYSIDEALPSIPWNQIDELAWDLDITIEFEMNRTHWALKDADLFGVLIEAGLIQEETLSAAPSESPLHRHTVVSRQSIEARPVVFRVPIEAPDERLVSVMMPFGAPFDSVYSTISEVCASLKLDCQRADEIFDQSEVIQDIFSLIYRSAVVICDFTDRNPNVYYETGIAHTLGRPVITLTQSPEHVTFDLQHHRYIQYVNNGEGLETFKPKLMDRLRRLLHLPTT